MGKSWAVWWTATLKNRQTGEVVAQAPAVHSGNSHYEHRITPFQWSLDPSDLPPGRYALTYSDGVIVRRGVDFTVPWLDEPVVIPA